MNWYLYILCEWLEDDVLSFAHQMIHGKDERAAYRIGYALRKEGRLIGHVPGSLRTNDYVLSLTALVALAQGEHEALPE